MRRLKAIWAIIIGLIIVLGINVLAHYAGEWGITKEMAKEALYETEQGEQWSIWDFYLVINIVGALIILGGTLGLIGHFRWIIFAALSLIGGIAMIIIANTRDIDSETRLVLSITGGLAIFLFIIFATVLLAGFFFRRILRSPDSANISSDKKREMAGAIGEVKNLITSVTGSGMDQEEPIQNKVTRFIERLSKQVPNGKPRPSMASQICTNCGQHNAQGSRLCGGCGRELPGL